MECIARPVWVVVVSRTYSRPTPFRPELGQAQSIGIVTGDPGVFWGYPDLPKTRTRSRGRGFGRLGYGYLSGRTDIGRVRHTRAIFLERIPFEQSGLKHVRMVNEFLEIFQGELQPVCLSMGI